MKEELKVYKEITEAIKMDVLILNLKQIFEELNIDEKTLEIKLCQDYDIQELARKKVKNYRND